MGVDYPETFIRGIPNDSYVEDGYPATNLFIEFTKNDERDDELLELSIIWNDKEESIVKMLEQKKKNSEEIQFKIGGACFSTAGLRDLCNNNPHVKGLLFFERKPIDGNIYHGNLLTKNGLSKNKRNLIASGIVFCFHSLIPRK